MQALQASECMRQSSHNFAVFSLRTIPTIGELMRSRSPCYSLPSRPIHRCVDVQLLICRRSLKLMSISEGATHPWWWRPTDLLETSLWLEQSPCSFSVTLPVLWQTVLSTLQVLNLVVLIPTFIGSLLQKPLSSAMMYADWIHSHDITRHSLLVMHVVFRFLLRIFV